MNTSPERERGSRPAPPRSRSGLVEGSAEETRSRADETENPCERNRTAHPHHRRRAGRPIRPHRRARELLTAAEVVFGSEQVLAFVPELRAERRVLGGDLHEAVNALNAVLGRQRVAILAAGDPLFLRRGPLSLRPSRSGSLRGVAARQQHADGIRPGEGDLGRRLLDQSANASTGNRAGPHPHGRDRGPVPQRDGRPGRGRPALLLARPRLFPGLRLRKPRRPRRARNAG